MAKHVFGIDLGTTYSCIAYVDETGRATAIENKDSNNTTPSVVSYAYMPEVVVGEAAKDEAVIYPDKTCSFVKRLMGKSDFAISVDGETRSPERVSSDILKKLAKDASEALGEEVKDVVITCPAYFGVSEREATKNAGIIAGLNVLEIISEPTAAAIYYGCTREAGEKTILVYDLGGGTFDVTIMRISSDKIEIICSDGEHSLGGRDWDEKVIGYLQDEFREETNFSDEFSLEDEQNFNILAEKVKIALTSKPQTRQPVQAGTERAAVTMTREQFDNLTEELLLQSITKTKDAAALAEEKGYTIDEILLVGGSTKMPQVEKALREAFDAEIKMFEPNEAVAKGAAIHAVNVYIENQNSLQEWSENDDTTAVSKEVLENKDNYEEKLAVNLDRISITGAKRQVIVATTKSYGVKMKLNGEIKCNNLIIKNTPMPDNVISSSKVYGTEEDNMSNIDIRIYESDNMDEYYEVDEAFLLGTAVLELPPGLKEDSPIEIGLELNSEGLLKVVGIDRTNGGEVHAEMYAKGIMSKEEVAKQRKKSLGETIM